MVFHRPLGYFCPRDGFLSPTAAWGLANHTFGGESSGAEQEEVGVLLAVPNRGINVIFMGDHWQMGFIQSMTHRAALPAQGLCSAATVAHPRTVTEHERDVPLPAPWLLYHVDPTWKNHSGIKCSDRFTFSAGFCAGNCRMH